MPWTLGLPICKACCLKLEARNKASCVDSARCDRGCSHTGAADGSLACNLLAIRYSALLDFLPHAQVDHEDCKSVRATAVDESSEKLIMLVGGSWFLAADRHVFDFVAEAEGKCNVGAATSVL